MGLIDLIRYRAQYQKFVASMRKVSDLYEGAEPEERERLMSQFVLEVEEPLEKAWHRLSADEKDTVLKEISRKKEPQHAVGS